MAYIDFPDGLENQKKRKAFWLSEEGLTLIRGWRRNGVSIKDIVKQNIGISMTAWYGWFHEFEDLRKACNDGKDVANYAVEDALFRRAVGYDYEERVFELVEGEMTLVRVFSRHLPPDVKAILSWLYNRKPDMWRAVQEPLESTQYAETIKSILVAMKEVAENQEPQQVEVKEEVEVQK